MMESEDITARDVSIDIVEDVLVALNSTIGYENFWDDLDEVIKDEVSKALFNRVYAHVRQLLH